MPESPAPGVTETRSPHSGDLQQVQSLVDALGRTWIFYRLYQDPRSLEGFHAAVEVLGSAPSFPWLVEVHREGFVWNGRPVPARRSAVNRLAQATFTRGIGALGFTAPPSPDDLLALLDVIGGQSAAAGTGPLEALAQSGSGAVLLVEHGTLVEGQGEGAAPAEGHIVVDRGAYQAGPATGAGEQSSGDGVEQFLDRYLWRYGRFQERMEPDDLLKHAELMRSCIDSLSSLSREDQAELLSRLLGRHEEAAFRTLLDQFGDDELARLARDLDARAHPLLREYLRIACDQQSRSHHLEHRILEGEDLTGHLAGRIERLLGGTLREESGSAAARIAAQTPDGAQHLRAAVRTLAAMLDTPDEERFRRLLRVWSQKVVTALGDGDLPTAEAWLGAIGGSQSARDRWDLVRSEAEHIVRAGLLDRFMADPVAGAGRGGLVATLARLALGPLIDQLGTEPDRGRRRALVDVIAAAAGEDPGPVVRRLQDPRWYLVRNLVVALARSRRPEVIAALAPLCAHDDHRVRAETLRALRALSLEVAEQAALEALDDPHLSVRLQALKVLRAGSLPGVEEALARRLADGPPLEEGREIVSVLAERRTAPARAHLAALAARRLVLSPTRRAIRSAARRALEQGAT
ncbi:MAG: HEAT repeat domain-containing protein [Actinomycetota bacterium]